MGRLLIDGTAVLTSDGLSAAQVAAVEAATRLLPMRAWHDGLVRSIAALLPGGPPWPNSDVMGAIEAALADLGVVTPLLSGPEEQIRWRHAVRHQHRGGGGLTGGGTHAQQTNHRR